MSEERTETLLFNIDIGGYTSAVKSIQQEILMGYNGQLDIQAIPIIRSADIVPSSLWPYPIEELRQSLYGATLHIETEGEYKELTHLWALMGGHINPRHKGWKAPEEYGTSKTHSLNEVGLFRELDNVTTPTHDLCALRALITAIRI